MLTTLQIENLYSKYKEIALLEIEEFGCKPTEVRHLLGRLGEFHCALEVGGTLAHEANQHGFDVVAPDGRKISVKTTAQKSGFVTINPNTLDKVDLLMLLQYNSSQTLTVVYFGSIEAAIEVSRTWDGKYELDISKARKLAIQKIREGLPLRSSPSIKPLGVL